MRALTYEKHGDPRDGVVKKVFDPRPGPGQVVVRVVAAALNPADWKIVEGRLPFLKLPKRPFVPGCEAAGVVESLDARVSGLREGEEVVCSTGFGGALAEKFAVSALQVVRKPGALSFEEAAAIPAAGMSALQSLRDLGGLREGQRLLVNGAGGGVGAYAVQIGKLLGAHVTAVASEGKHELLAGLGADALLDYRKSDFTAARETWDVVFDVVPNRSFGTCSRVLSPEGVYVTTLPGPGPFLASIAAALRAPFGFRKRCRALMLKPRPEDLVWLLDRAEKGKLKAVVGKVVSLDQAAGALSDLSTGHVTGKTVVRVA
ncbi:MAG TPA: NAD(P)-dependent alcohol dehydrogenase [Thermoanaerobaculia bacterium]|nr:NAD(P)-dependent alcohol dehydrogenase [Thermoanaerobaculia bacterium]